MDQNNPFETQNTVSNCKYSMCCQELTSAKLFDQKLQYKEQHKNKGSDFTINLYTMK